jgi:hypothetical protein
MLMRDPMHQIDWGAIVHLIKAILRKFQECVEIALDKVGLAAKKLRQRFELMLAKRNDPDNQSDQSHWNHVTGSFNQTRLHH